MCPGHNYHDVDNRVGNDNSGSSRGKTGGGSIHHHTRMTASTYGHNLVVFKALLLLVRIQG